MITDKNLTSVTNHALADTYVNADLANDANNRFGAIRASGGFDNAGRADDLVTAQTGAPSTPDGLFNNCFFYRCGLAQHPWVLQVDGTTKSGKYSTRADFEAAVLADKAAAFAAADGNLFPRCINDTERSGVAAKQRANIPAVQGYLKNSGYYNQFNTDPFANELPYKQRLTGVDIRPNDSAKTLVNSALPSRRGINTGANFAGAIRDSAWYVGWNFASTLGGYGANIFGSAARCEVPVVSVSVPSGSSSRVITFGTTTGHKYVVEVSTDNRVFTELNIVTATEATKSITDNSAWTGTPRFYRVIAL
jgi:hypothetical protein